MKICLALFLLLLAVHAHGEIHWVWPDLCIQTAVDTAAELDTILIGDGTYNETVVPYGKSLTIASHFLLYADTNHIASTIVRPGTTHPDTNSCFVYAYSEAPGNRLVGLTLRDGTGTWHALSGTFDGGGVYACSSSVSVEHCRITNCTAERFGGGIFAVDRAVLMRFDLQVLDCTIDSCSSGVFGGGISASAGRISIRRTRFLHDQAGFSGGGGSVLNFEGDVDSCNFSHCYASSSEGGLLMGWGHGNLSNCVFDSNRTSDSWADVGHLSFVDMEGAVIGCTFRNNLSRAGSIVLYAREGQTIRFLHNVVEDNPAPVAMSTIYVWYPHGGEIAYNLFRNNVNLGLPVIQVAGAGTTIRIHHNVFQGNVCETPSSASVAQTQVEPCMSLDSNWIAENSYQTVALQGQWTPCVVDARNNWWGHASGPHHPTQNPGGQGDTLISDSVLFIPWLTEPPDTTMPPDYLGIRESPAVAKTWELMDVYPNPFNSSVRIVLAGFTGTDFEITLHNLLGQIVDVVHNGPLTGGELTYTAPAYLASGVYFLKASDRHHLLTKKVVLMK